MKKIIWTMVVVAAAGSQLGSTDCGQVLRDPSFDLWCGDHLCAWKVERGQIAKVPTWNQGDPGVELDGSDVAIEQLSPVNNIDTQCIEFDLIADVDETAEVDLNIDVFGDGSVEHSERIPTSHWKPVSFLLPIQGTYSGIRFELAKHGSGRAVIAQVQAQTSDQCGGLPAIVPAPAPDGAACSAPSGCRSGLCGAGTLFADQCVGCDGTGPCGAGQVCGLGDPTSPVFGIPLECVAAGARQLGDNCYADAECATGICTAGACSTCRTDGTGCTAGQTCQAAWPQPASFMGFYWHTPYLCNAGAHQGAAGAACASDDDCASANCAGPARQQCDDGRACATAADCPFGDHNGLENGPCNTVGVQGGSCQ